MEFCKGYFFGDYCVLVDLVDVCGVGVECWDDVFGQMVCGGVQEFEYVVFCLVWIGVVFEDYVDE